MNLIPAVRNRTSLPGTCHLESLRKFRSAGLNAAAEKLVSERLKELAVARGNKGFFAEFTASAAGLKPIDAGKGFDAYVLQITEKAVRIDANTAAGLFYGIQTFLQLPGDAPCGTIRDEAAIPVRMIHWDLKGYQPTLKTLLEELKILASFKVNAILLELEDKYDYRCAPEVGVADAYTFRDLRKISRAAADLNIMVVPKLQCLAHVDYLLKHKRYHALREDGYSFQYCASNPDAQKLWNSMADELIEAFAEHTQYFHIGADETDRLGICPECKKLGRGGSYIHKVQQSIDHVLSRGRTPVMWEDILRNLHNNLSPEEARQCWSLGKKAVLMYWAYGYGGRNNTFPFLKGYLSEGMRVWGASGFAGCDNWAGSVPPLEVRAPNLDAWTKSAIEEKLECIVATGWTRIASADCPAEPQESSWFSILYAAASMWSGVPCDLTKFIYSLSSRLYGEVPDPELVESVKNIAKAPYRLEFLADKDFSNDRLAFLRLAAAAESLTVERNLFCNWNQYYFGRLGKALADYRVDYMNRYPVLRTEKIRAFKKQIRPVLRKFYGETTVEDFINTRFGYLEKIIADTEDLVKKTKKC